MPVTSEMISAEVFAVAGEEIALARKLQDLGFRVFPRDRTVSIDGPESLWGSVFGVRFEARSQAAAPGLPDESQVYRKAIQSTLKVPADLESLIEDIAFVEPPEFY